VIRCYCGAEMTKRPGMKRVWWGCTRDGCDGRISAHRDGRPMGIPTDAATRKARIAAHEAFDRLWREAKRPGARARAYRWLQQAMELSVHECHIARMDRAACERVVILCNERAPRAKVG
jgi:hypothetical protein